VLPPEFIEEVIVQAVFSESENSFLDRFYFQASGHYPLIGFYPGDQIMQLGDREAIQQRFMLHLADYRYPLIQHFGSRKD
jgi:hypothetical protein